MHVFLRQENSVTVVAGLSQNLDGDLHVKVDFTFTALLKNTCGTIAGSGRANVLDGSAQQKKHTSHAHLDELLQLGAVFQLGVAVQQQGGVVCVGQRLPVQGLQVRCQVVDPLSIQELPDDVGRLQFPNGAAGQHRGFQSWNTQAQESA